VKEQTIGLYSKRLAAHGFVVVVYDSSYQGASGGEPRLLEDPTTRVEDARCAADFLTTLAYVDVERIGVFGVCAGGGYALAAAQTERRFEAVAGVSPTLMGEAARSIFGQPIPAAELIKTLEAAAGQRRRRRGEKNPSTPRLFRSAWKTSTKTRRRSCAKGTTTTGRLGASTPTPRAAS
jgi:dienelactone hydrolase